MDFVFYPLFSEFRIYTPPKADSFEPVATLDNSARNQPWTFQFQEEIGIEATNGQKCNQTLTTELGIEIKGAFSAGMTTAKHGQLQAMKSTPRKQPLPCRLLLVDMK